nr:hypothetical protein [Tanacetum cinerariifolium]
MMSQTTLPKSFWDYALETAARILNMVPTKKVEKTPYKVWHGQAPKLSYLKVWGYEEFVKRDTLTKPDKLDPKSFKCIFAGYPKETMGYSFYSPSENKHELRDLGEPANYKAALLDPESKKWLDAMNVEMQSMKDNDVLVLVKLPPNARTDGSKWLFKKKTDMDGVVYIFKARLVAKGFTQTYGVDYEETFFSYVKSYLGRSFAMKDLGDAAYILGIKIYRDRSKRLIGLCQSAYIDKILRRYYMENSKRGTIPMQENLKLSKSQGASTPSEKQHMQNVPYDSAIGSIMYAVRCTRPDVAFAQNIKSQFQQDPGNMERELRVSCYTDAGYLTDADNLKSYTGYVFVLYGGDVDWKKPISMYCDNTRAIAIAKDDGVTKGTRHFREKVHYLRETIKLGDVKIEKIDTGD